MTDSKRDCLSNFALEAQRFVDWATGTDDQPMTARSALVRLVSLYQSGLALPEPDFTENDRPPAPKPNSKEIVLTRAKTLGLQYYSVIFDPLEVPQDGNVIGDLTDDICDIYLDIARSLAVYESGDPAEAHWNWHFSLWTHWGHHAVCAISALHAVVERRTVA
jgi:hypothetical protein